MNDQIPAKDTQTCCMCSNQTEERCFYCLLPICPEHRQHIQPWFMRRQMPVCTPCHVKLETIAQEEELVMGSKRTAAYGSYA